MPKFKIVGIVAPGKINVLLNAGFCDVELHNASDEVLEQLYNSNCRYVQLTPEEFLARNPELNDIKIKPLKLKNRTIPSPE